jgi:3-hydroxyethyl bacteriochlorophyllide a dehydrogenase
MDAHAVVITAAHQFGLAPVQLTPAQPQDITIATRYTSISAGTERMLLDGRMPHPMLQFPVIPGYETVGEVVAVGAEAPPELLGQMVYVGGARCFAGVNPAWGGQASHLHVDYQRAVPLTAMEPRDGVLLALAATALHGVDLAGDLAGKKVLVIGQGPVGQLAARHAKLRGATVYVSDISAERLAKSHADKQIIADSTGLAAHGVSDCDVIIEASGKMAALIGAIGCLALNGRIVLLGYYDELHLPYMPLFLKQAQLITAKEWAPGDLQRCRDLIASKKLDVSPLITHQAAITDVVQAYATAFDDVSCIKLVLTW